MVTANVGLHYNTLVPVQCRWSQVTWRQYKILCTLKPISVNHKCMLVHYAKPKELILKLYKERGTEDEIPSIYSLGREWSSPWAGSPVKMADRMLTLYLRE